MRPEHFGLPGRKRIAIFRQRDGRCEDFGRGHRSPRFQGSQPGIHSPRNRGRANAAQRNGFAHGLECRPTRRSPAAVKRGQFPRLGIPDLREGIAAQMRVMRLHDGQSRSHCDSRVSRIAPSPQNFHSDQRGERVGGRDHARPCRAQRCSGDASHTLLSSVADRLFCGIILAARAEAIAAIICTTALSFRAAR